MTSRPPPGGWCGAGGGRAFDVSFGFEDATLCAVASGEVSRFWPGWAGAYDDPIRMTVKSVMLMTMASSAVRRRACMFKVMGKGGSGG